MAIFGNFLHFHTSLMDTGSTKDSRAINKTTAISMLKQERESSAVPQKELLKTCWIQNIVSHRGYYCIAKLFY